MEVEGDGPAISRVDFYQAFIGVPTQYFWMCLTAHP